MALCRVTYTSRVARSVRFEDAEEIARGSAVRNDALAVTGLLLYTPSHFIQVLEGEQAAVRSVLERIYADSRHSAIRLVLEQAIEHREFDRWAMRASIVPRDMRVEGIEELDHDALMGLLRQISDRIAA